MPIFAIIAFIYAVAGQGGASAYLAILALFNITYSKIPSLALACNIAASAGIVYHFYRAGHLRYRLVVPFIIGSIPAAFVGGILYVPEQAFKIILTILLFLISFRMFFWKADKYTVKIPSMVKAYTLGSIIGLIIGFLAGLVGFGGGILLLPVLVFLKWGNVKSAAVAAGLFTLVNSVSALIGHGIGGTIDWMFLGPLVLAVVVGSQIGAFLGAKKVSGAFIQKIFSIILFFVAARLLVSII